MSGPLDGLTPEEITERYWRYAYRAALDEQRPESTDDLAQEALVAVWKAAKAKPDASASYFATAARRRVAGIVGRGAAWTGGDSKPGPKSRPAEIKVDWQDEGISTTMGHLLEAGDLLGAIEAAYHRGEIGQALSGLGQHDREYVLQRFWGGKTDVEIAAERDVDRKLLSQRWRRYIRPALAKRLEHLASIA